jgi:hypothetical protein
MKELNGYGSAEVIAVRKIRSDISDIVGDEGEDLARLALRRIAWVSEEGKDIGLDFHCQLRENPAFEFWVQAKGSEDPTYGANNTISSGHIDRRTIESYWLEKWHPVFVFMSDTRKRQTYFLPVTGETYQPRDDNSKTHVFQIPFENEITRENIGKFVAEVVRHQRVLTPNDALAWVEHYRQEHPLLHQDFDQIETFLEIMRGSDQSAQVEAKFVIKELFEAGKLDSDRLVNGLVAIFHNCRDVVTQGHVLDALIFLQARQVIPDVIGQISRNLSLPEYQRAHPEHRARYTSFLFTALVRLEARNVLPDIRAYFRHSEWHVVQEAAYACGELRLRGGGRDLLQLLSHPDSNVRIMTAQALATYGHKYIVEECVQTIRAGNDTKAIHGATYVLAYLKNRDYSRDVVKFVNDDDPDVRQSVAHYLGFVDAHNYAGLLVHLAADDDLYVRSEAGMSFIDGLPLPDEEKEQLVLPKLAEAFDQGEELKAASLLGMINRCGSEAARPLLLRIYWEDDGILTNHPIRDANGNMRGIKPIDLKTQALGILRRFDVPEIHEDIVHQITHAGKDVLVTYINAARDLKLPDAFDAITSIRDEYMLSLSGLIVTALLELDQDQAANWAVSQINNKPSLAVCLVCCSIFELVGLQKRVTEVVRKHLWRHFRDPANRLVTGIYRYLRDYGVAEATPVIIEDLNVGRYENLQEDQAFLLICQMLETLATVGGQQGRDYLISLLPDVGPSLRMQILNLLSTIADEPSMEAIGKCLYDPIPDVRVLANRLIGSSTSLHSLSAT